MKRPGSTIAQRLWLPIVEALRSQAARLSGMVSSLRIGQARQAIAPPSPPSPPPPRRPAEVAQAAINQAKASSRPTTSGPKGSADDWEDF